MSQLLSEGTRKARKPHRCSLCGRIIDPGESYHHSSSADGGTVSVWRQCQHCCSLADEVDLLGHLADPWEGYGPDDMDEVDPRNLREMRLLLYYRRGWRRPDGTLRDHGEVFPTQEEA